jgi:hypothetical protein
MVAPLVKTFPSVLYNPGVHRHIHNSLPPVCYQPDEYSQHPPTIFLFRQVLILFSQLHMSLNGLLTSRLSHECYMPWTSHPLFDNPKSIWWKLLVRTLSLCNCVRTKATIIIKRSNSLIIIFWMFTDRLPFADQRQVPKLHQMNWLFHINATTHRSTSILRVITTTQNNSSANVMLTSKCEVRRKLTWKKNTLEAYFNVLLLVTVTGWSEDPESYARGSIATGRGSHAEQVKGDETHTIPWSSGWGLGVGLTPPPCKTWICLETSNEASEKEESLGGHGPKTGRSAIEEEEEGGGRV